MVRLVWLTLLLLCAGMSQLSAAEITAIPLDRPGQGVVILNGDIEIRDRETFLTKIAPFSGGMVMLNSRGGSAYAGIEIGKAIRMRSFTTWVPSGSFCASACAAAWLGGSRRLMGKTALIGFHSVYQITNGQAVETSSGNAIFGAYLSQLGLSDRAIMYLSDAAPNSMNWLTPAEAKNLDINLTVFDAEPNTTTAAPDPKPLDSLATRSRNFVIALNVLVSGPNEKLVGVLSGIYSDQVLYYGKELSRANVIAQVINFSNRWPIRVYAANSDSMSIQCEEQLLKCRISGLIDFDARNVTRATFDYLLVFRSEARWPTIVMESGTVVDRQVDSLTEESPTEGKALFPLESSAH